MDNKEKALLAWQVVTAVLALKKEASLEVVNGHLENTPKPHVLAIQFILLGSGFADEGLVADGDYGDYSLQSLGNLYIIAHANT